MSSPIQVVLNTENFDEARDANGGGSNKDFYAFKDNDFLQHRDAIKKQIGAISNIIRSQNVSEIGYIKVVLKREAWAKSHRPVIALFKPGKCTLAGGGDLGVMFFEVTPSSLAHLEQEIDKADSSTKLKRDPATNKDKPNPNIQRSELGAIERLELLGAQDKRSFTVQEAVEWLKNPLTGSGYQVELFEIPPAKNNWDTVGENRLKLYQSFEDGLKKFGIGLTARLLITNDKSIPILTMRLNKSADAVTLKFIPSSLTDHRHAVAAFDENLDRHTKLLDFLDNHPLVRRICLPGIVVRSGEGSATEARRQVPAVANIPIRDSKVRYPKIGIIDGGVGNILSDWIVGGWNPLADEDQDVAHGTFIAGLTVFGSSLNNEQICKEIDGCEIVDLSTLPSEEAFLNYYPEGISQFLDEVESAVADSNARYGVRIFNMSLNIKHPVQPDYYSEIAARLDKIADDYNVIIFISAGNAGPADERPEWPTDETSALANLAGARNDGIQIPAESARNIAVGALNPPGSKSYVPFAPTTYSCRGPGLRTGVKPDLSHFGGAGTECKEIGTGLFSINPDGSVTNSCGTSYSTPLVAKTAASLESMIEGEPSRETLIALMAHHAAMPDLLNTKAFESIGRHLAGYGVPASAHEMLHTNEHEITLVFASRIKEGQQVNFRFRWPPSLVSEGGICRGYARLTLVSSPPLDQRFGAEFVRINIDAALQQEQAPRINPNTGEEKPGGWKGRLDPIYLPGGSEKVSYESEQIMHGLKWSPIKIYEKNIPRGVGPSSSWRLFVDYLTRTGQEMPKDGVPFTAILTIRDPKKEAPVFNDMKKILTDIGIKISDIQTAARITTRV